MNKFSIKFLTLAAMLMSLTACPEGVNDSLNLAEGETREQGFDTVNGSVTIQDDAIITGEIEVVNGRISIGNNAKVVGDIEAVNGRIQLGEGAITAGIETVNGRIEASKDIRVTGNVETVNGNIYFANGGAEVDGNVFAVNGLIKLFDATITGNVSNFNGGIYLEDGTKIEGSLKVEKPNKNGGFNISFGKKQIPLIIFGKNVSIDGDVVFEREVNLYVHESADVAKIRGADAILYTEDLPPQTHN